MVPDRVPVRYAREPPAQGAWGLDDALAIVLVPPLPQWASSDCRWQLGTRERVLPVLGVIDPADDAHDEATDMLYEHGADAVFPWPRDRQPLQESIKRLAGPHIDWNGRTDRPPDSALQVLIEQRLRTHPAPVGEGIDVSVLDGHAMLVGIVNAAWKRDVAYEQSNAVGGVRVAIADMIMVIDPEG
jgi:hypothetical protein